MKKMKLLSLGLAMVLFMTQPAYANLITPFGGNGQTQTAPGIQMQQPGAQMSTQVQTGVQAQPGAQMQQTGVQVQQPAAQTTDTQMQAGSQEGPKDPASLAAQQQQLQYSGGPGAYEQSVSQVIQPSASYSTKEAVQQSQSVPGSMAPGNIMQQATVGDSAQQSAATAAQVAAIQKPVVSSEAAVLYDVTHNKILFEKNGDKKLYPASTTKLMTALLVLEKANLTDMVTFSEKAVTNLESGAVTLGLKAGDKVSVKDSLYGMMLKSANEVANGLAEHVGGSISGFADMMNTKAVSLGCTGTHFVNPNGLNDSNHYTTAQDMAKIAAAAFANPKLCEITSTREYTFPATKGAAARKVTMGHKMLYPTDSRYYPGIVGGKTGYTSLAGNTLVTCVEKDGVRMIAVVLKSKSTHYQDTKAMLDYGYAVEKAGSCAGSTSGQFGTSTHHRWVADGNTWRFVLADGTILSNCFVRIDGTEYAFDTEGRMVTGWRSLLGNWHCFDANGSMVKNAWRQDAGKWFYLGADGVMMKNAWINNQYYVGADGVWVQNQ